MANAIKKYFPVWVLAASLLILSCQNQPGQETKLYTCPMPEDSVFSEKPGRCPKCGMELMAVSREQENKLPVPAPDTPAQQKAFTCPMHPQIQEDSEGECPICGMKLERTKSPLEPKAVSLNTLLKPSNQQVIANVPMIHMMEREEDIEMETYGIIDYDTRHTGIIPADFSGRIEKLYVRYRFQKVVKGQRIMDIYSPELLTAEENLLFLIKHDPGNTSLINAAKQKLLLLGIGEKQLSDIIRSGKPLYAVTIYSRYTGHIHEAQDQSNVGDMPSSTGMSAPATTSELSLKEGMYVQKGQKIFSVFNPARAWALLNIFPGQANLAKTGNRVRITPETDPGKGFRATISYIEPVYRQNSKTMTARVYFDNSTLLLPIGGQVKATIFGGERAANWLPEEAVISLGLDKVVFVRTGESFIARKIQTGITNKHLIQVLSGLDKKEAVAANAQYLVDSESFIKTN